jgi:hypothetical protein
MKVATDIILLFKGFRIRFAFIEFRFGFWKLNVKRWIREYSDLISEVNQIAIELR